MLMVNSLDYSNFKLKTLPKENGSSNTTKGLTSKVRSHIGFTKKGPNKELHKLPVGANLDSSYAKSESLCAL
jgi:hypothetical protein